ncbi:tumor necrosis factor receptor superfamily member 14-like isoform X2 [Neoarius graeffei]|uniref:tumor necrosis factor receptor superfamily member 14-like isoform X2 n=1 Tax=Neoarius graeffei TaxID=443677 RepID=UPI00298CF037|nr:tumor necrosis factor receptor superfamily member 14-like isoform X2 [Neoarius graeffei]
MLKDIQGVSAVLTYGASCRKGEYRSTAGECCPMCSIGTVVIKDCIGDYSTACRPCTKGTFMNEPNGLPDCFPCKTCDAGLFILQDCTGTKNTVCEVLDGYYCSQYSDVECDHAVKHSECKPGQHIKAPGTKASDTVCEPCPLGFYSPEGVNCTKWTDCSVRHEVEVQEGTSIRDVQCKPTRERYGLIPVFVLCLPTVLVLFFKHKMNCCTGLKSPVMETNPEVLECAASSSKQEENEEVDQPAAR